MKKTSLVLIALCLAGCASKAPVEVDRVSYVFKEVSYEFEIPVEGSEISMKHTAGDSLNAAYAAQTYLNGANDRFCRLVSTSGEGVTQTSSAYQYHCYGG